MHLYIDGTLGSNPQAIYMETILFTSIFLISVDFHPKGVPHAIAFLTLVRCYFIGFWIGSKKTQWPAAVTGVIKAPPSWQGDHAWKAGRGSPMQIDLGHRTLKFSAEKSHFPKSERRLRSEELDTALLFCFWSVQTLVKPNQMLPHTAHKAGVKAFSMTKEQKTIRASEGREDGKREESWLGNPSDVQQFVAYTLYGSILICLQAHIGIAL